MQTSDYFKYNPRRSSPCGGCPCVSYREYMITAWTRSGKNESLTKQKQTPPTPKPEWMAAKCAVTQRLCYRFISDLWSNQCAFSYYCHSLETWSMFLFCARVHM